MKIPAPSARTVTLLAWATGLLVLAAVGWMAVRLTSVSAENDQLVERFEVGAEDRADLRERLEQRAAEAVALEAQVRDLGEDPVVVPSDDEDTPDLTQVGPPGPPGSDGRDGRPGRPGADGEPGEDGAEGPRGASGAAGADGAAGSDGADGTPGSDSAVPGPQGPAGPTGSTGERGPAGPAGSPGADGRSAWPFSFTFTHDGSTYVVDCVAPAAPCTVSTPDPPPPSEDTPISPQP